MKLSRCARVAGITVAPALLVSVLPWAAQADSGNPPGIYRVVAVGPDSDGDGSVATSRALCEAGDTAISGGELSRGLVAGDQSGPYVSDNVAPTPVEGWQVALVYGTSQAYVMCEDAGGPQGTVYTVSQESNGVDEVELYCDGAAGSRDTALYAILSNSPEQFAPNLVEGDRPVGFGELLPLGETAFVYCTDDNEPQSP